ncbi:gamma-mobile-trio integrase GmtZ [Mesoterricola silvestris]|uniref:Integrase n=1 Tax=Mesoterricola silvestris TaxID=2927979 RepID=A0AA48K8K7_9BACT|nr:integrase family protein [Mesoterricola silvestris]BDU71422.1 integrase [Mesoterricola silvestris]
MAVTRGKAKKTWRTLDLELKWASRQYPELEAWRGLAAKWIDSDKDRTSHKFNLQALSMFLDKFILQQRLPLDPKKFLLTTSEIPDFFETVCPKSHAGAIWNNRMHAFIEFVLRDLCSTHGKSGRVEVDPAYRNPVKYRNSNTFEHGAPRTRIYKPRHADTKFSWITWNYPQVEEWRLLAARWMGTAHRGVRLKVDAVGTFLEKYLARQGLLMDIPTFFLKTTLLPDVFGTIYGQSTDGIRQNNSLHDFLGWVMTEKLTVENDHGRVAVPDIYRNPVAYKSYSLVPKLDESVHSPLPFGYIEKLRTILASGPNFSDWTWAQTASGPSEGKGGAIPAGWLPVTEDQIDRNDPDCVVRVRKRADYSGGDVLEMWSPVRWVALLVKLLVPLRTFQVRVLDSGEADTWKLDGGQWVLNSGPLAQGTEGMPRQQGVLRRRKAQDGTFSTELYINTNKTADIAKSGPHLGFTVPWPQTPGPVHRDVYYWLEKLRNWQSKYNPIKAPTRWSDLDHRHVGVKSAIQLAAYPDACFLFRHAEAQKKSERKNPLTDGMLGNPWYMLLGKLEEDLAAERVTHSDGSKIRLVLPGSATKRTIATNFPLHSLRVSMVTALALDGQVPFHILAKAVGHARLLMTLYYTKPGATRIEDALADGVARLEANQGQSILAFLRDTKYSRMLETAICNSPTGLAATIPENPADRNPAGWMEMGIGMCLVGGNVSELEENKRIGGCFNGGAITDPSHHRYGPVPGGPRNCVRCRWFVTMPHYLPALAARFNNLSYQVDEAVAEAVRNEQAHEALEAARFDAATAGVPFDRMNELNRAERLRETAIGRWNELAESLVACWKLIERCLDALKEPSEGMKLISVGSSMDVQARFEETDSELLQLSGVCEDLELYPDLETGKAILRRSQLLDAAFAHEGLPPMFLRFSEREQLVIGNAVMRQLAKVMNPAKPEIGKREVIALMDAGERLGERLGADLTEILAGSPEPVKLVHPHGNGAKNALHDRHSS